MTLYVKYLVTYMGWLLKGRTLAYSTSSCNPNSPSENYPQLVWVMVFRVKGIQLRFNCSKNTNMKINILFWTKTPMVPKKNYLEG